MPNKKATPQQRAKAQKMWEVDGLPFRAISEKLGFSMTTVQRWRKVDGWNRGEPETITIPTPVGDVEIETADTVAVEAVVTEAELSDAERIADLQATVARLEAEKSELRQDVDLVLPDTPEEWIEWMGREHIEFISMVNINRERKGQGFNPVEFKSGDAVLEREVMKTAQTLADRKNRWAGESNMRCLKMAKKDPSSPTGWRIAAIPMEPTINNFNAGPDGAAGAIQRYVRKGFRLITPALCQREPCNALAAVFGGSMQYQGYCTEAHMNDDPFINSDKIKGVTGMAQSAASRTPGNVLADVSAGTPGGATTVGI